MRRESAERLGGFQHRDMIGHARGKAVGDQARASLGGGELIGIFEVIEEGQVPGASLVERGEPPDLLPPARGIGERGLRQRSHVG